MAIVAGGIVEGGMFKVLGHLPGRSAGLNYPDTVAGRRLFGLRTSNPQDFTDTHIDRVPAAGAGSVPSLLAGSPVEQQGNTGRAWFEAVHIYGGSTLTNPGYLQDFKIEFGNILGQEDREFLVYSAYRKISVTLNSFTNNVSPGVEFPVVTPPVVVGPQSAILGAASTFNSNLTTGLGVEVRETVRALLEGLASFNDTIVFNFSSGDTPVLPLSGQRVAVILARPEMPYTYTLEFKNDNIPSGDGHTQRIVTRPIPREIYNFPYRLTGVEKQRLESYLFDRQAALVGNALYDEEIVVTADISIGASVFSVVGGDETDFRVGGIVMVYESDDRNELFTILSVTATTVTITGVTIDTHPAFLTTLVPIRISFITNEPQGSVFKVDGADLRIEFTVDDVDTGTPASSPSDWNPNTYLGLPLLDECNLISGSSSPQEFKQEIVVIDNDTGLISQASLHESNKRRRQKGFSMQSRTDIKNVRSFIRWSEGTQKSFYIPTFNKDMTLAASLALGSATIDIERIDYRRFVGSRTPRDNIRFTYNDGSATEIKVIISAVDHPSITTQERLTLSTTWSANHDVSTIERIDYVELCAFDTSRFTFRVSRVGLATLIAPIQNLFDLR